MAVGRWFGGMKGSDDEVQDTSLPSPDAARSLVLYKFDSCPYCWRVQKVVAQLELDVEMADVRTDPARREELRSKTGRTQVPCLMIDDVPLFESRDIVVWLERYAKSGALPG